MTSRPNTCMIVDDDHLIVKYLTTIVEQLGHEVCAVAHEADEAARKAIELEPAVVFMDVRLGGARDGVDAAIEIHKHTTSRVFFITGSGDPATIERIHKDSPSGIFVKPINPKDVKIALASDVEPGKARTEGTTLEADVQTCLIVDDDILVGEHLRKVAEDIGLTVCGVVGDGETAIETAINHQPDVILMDVRLGGELDGVDAAIQIVSRARSRIVFITGSGDAATLERMQSHGPSGILIKPLDPQELRTTLRR